MISKEKIYLINKEYFMAIRFARSICANETSRPSQIIDVCFADVVLEGFEFDEILRSVCGIICNSFSSSLACHLVANLIMSREELIEIFLLFSAQRNASGSGLKATNFFTFCFNFFGSSTFDFRCLSINHMIA